MRGRCDMEKKSNVGKRFELLLLGLRKDIISKDGKINGRAVAEMSYEEIDEWLKKLKGDFTDD